MGHFVVSADYFGSEDSPKMGHFVVSAAVSVRVGKNIKQPAGRGEYRSGTYIYWVGPLCSSSRSPTLSYRKVSKEGGDVVCV